MVDSSTAMFCSGRYTDENRSLVVPQWPGLVQLVDVGFPSARLFDVIIQMEEHHDAFKPLTCDRVVEDIHTINPENTVPK